MQMLSGSMDLKKDESAGYLANHMARLFALALHERVGPLGLAPAQFMTLLELWNEDALTQKDLVQRLDVEQATMANTLQRMERDGLITRHEDPDDRRARLIRLTPKAKRLRGEATQAAKSVNEKALAGFSDKERRAFIDMMTRVIDALRD